MSKPKTDTWMPLYIGSYLADTMHLTTAQHGAYMLLLFYGWRSRGVIPADDAALASITKMTLKEWRASRPVLSQFFVEADGKWTQRRQMEELSKADERASHARENGSRGGRPRKPTDNPLGFSEEPRNNPAGSPEEPRGKPRGKPKPNPDESSSSSPTQEEKSKTSKLALASRSADADGEFFNAVPVEQSPKTKPARPPDPVWDAIAAEFYGGAVTDAHRGQVNRIVKNLKQLGATPDDIRTRAANYRANWPEIACTASALVKHWHTHARRTAPATPGRVHAAPGKYAHLDPSAVAQP